MELPGEVYDSCYAGDEAAVCSWLDNGGYVDAEVVEDGKSDGTLLMCAAAGASSGRTNLLSMVQLLMERGARLDTQNGIGWTALMGAAFEGSVAVVRFLLEAKADPDVENQNGNTALSIARQRHRARVVGCVEIIGLLRKHGAQRFHTEDTLTDMFADMAADGHMSMQMMP